ncbi:Transcriptional regulator GlxA family, contains an amidase domain and an AraC-type DNA-binding HTH domain [Amycolatopsis lurida]|uniref:AraC family transcriptional regulator n=1 Tax=Amycolatopsis lurida NRRL 2430 TaxID=1460371 RepID=A0A2P2FLV2_AMYLU|nr:helix-turn-helix domain-containing protein [Amycolatopsis lurida]KFU77705.1 AraC family transcriptional regulator [Amycolatopsis lurida NRRL 2430]SEB40103.1 Transcriptional regulator GlxA family, contains an amidase domain and an AraC-type DNA-binding HTH domain [Amycolatopsis lurida]
MSAPSVAVLAFEGISPFHLAVPSLVWGPESPAGDMEPWPITVAAVVPGSLPTSAGYSIDVPAGLGALAEADIVVVPWWSDPESPTPAPVVAALRAAHERGALVVGLCLGVFALADAGILDGRAATTHWKWVETFRKRFPSVQLRPEELYVDEGDIVTGAGATAGIDTCLHLLARTAGQVVANRVARRIVAAPHRPGGQAQFIELPVPAEDEDPLTTVMSWARSHPDVPHGIDDLAARAHMSRSTFTRSFRARTGTTVHSWLVAQRLARARHLLETTALGIDAVAAQSGFGTAARLREHFATALGTTPTRYRVEFSAGKSFSPS